MAPRSSALAPYRTAPARSAPYRAARSHRGAGTEHRGAGTEHHGAGTERPYAELVEAAPEQLRVFTAAMDQVWTTTIYEQQRYVCN